MAAQSVVGLSGGLTLVKGKGLPHELNARLRAWSPKSDLGRIVRECFRYLPADLAGELLDRITSVVIVESSLSGMVIRHPDNSGRGAGRLRDQLHRLHEQRNALLAAGQVDAAGRFLPLITMLSREAGLVEDCGILSRRVVTTAGVNFLVDAFQNLTEPETFKYHGLGTGNTAETVGDTTLVTELTTQYNPDSTRATGSTTEGASANIYRTVGTNTVDASAAVVEHGVFSASSGGTLWDRSVFSVVNLVSGDSFASTYDLTCTAGG